MCHFYRHRASGVAVWVIGFFVAVSDTLDRLTPQEIPESLKPN
jgi:hypothetical protein